MTHLSAYLRVREKPQGQVATAGTQATDGTVQWTHAIGHGPLGPVFQRDLTGNGMDRFIWTDHLGTPFAWHDPITDATTYTPYNPWGELLATQPPMGPPWATEGEVPTQGFTLATDAVFPLPPLGLAGHLYDVETGLVQMHHRYFSPRLGHFLTPDYRAPDIYDPSTFTEPYAYAAGNPMMFLDPDGLHEDYGWYVNQPEASPAEAFGALEALAWQGVEIKPEVRAILDESSVKANEFTAGNIQAAAEIAKETAVGLGQLAYIGGGTMLGIQDAQKRGQDLVWSVVTLEAFNQLGEQWARNIMLAEQASKNGDWALASRLLTKANTEMVSFGAGLASGYSFSRSFSSAPVLKKSSGNLSPEDFQQRASEILLSRKTEFSGDQNYGGAGYARYDSYAIGSGKSEYISLYHGTSLDRAAAITEKGINLNFARKRTDFGKGFYTTANRWQAEDWVQNRFAGNGKVLEFRIQRSEFEKLTFLDLENVTMSSLQRFIRHNKLGGRLHSNDIVSGPVLLNPRQFLNGAPIRLDGGQISFHSKNAINFLFRGLQ